MLMNAWYMAAWSEELAPATPLERTLVERSMVFFRDASGSAKALLNRCPHRFAPLHLGECTSEGTIRCRYHGLEFDGDGACTRNPHGDGRIPVAAKVPSFATLERNGMVWVWPGEQSLADESLLPDYSMVGDERCFVARRYLAVKANYVLESDNILDLSHIQYLHPGTLGSASVKDAVTRVEQEGNTVHSRRFVSGERLPPFLEATFQVPTGSLVDRWLDVRWNAPSSLLLTVSIGLSGKPREEAHTVLIPHIFSPATQSTTHYWFASCFDRASHADGGERAQRHVDGLSRPFETEDLPMLQAQQQVIGSQDFWSLRPVLLAGDAAAVRARRLLDNLIKAEQSRDAGPGALETIDDGA